jgi:hypothetical protein
MFQPLSEAASYGLLKAFVIVTFLLQERVSQPVLALVGPVSYGQPFVISLLQERVSQHVPSLVGDGLLRSLNSFHNISTSGAGFSTCLGPCRSCLLRSAFCNISTSGAGFSTCSDPCRSQPPTVY